MISGLKQIERQTKIEVNKNEVIKIANMQPC